MNTFTKLLLFVLVLIALLVPLGFMGPKNAKQASPAIVWPKICLQREELVGYRAISGYTLGNSAETDETPCIGAYGHDLCQIALTGATVCASNEFKANTMLKFDGIECTVLDRMNKRYTNRVDLAFTEYGLAKHWGVHYAKVYKLTQFCYE